MDLVNLGMHDIIGCRIYENYLVMHVCSHSCSLDSSYLCFSNSVSTPSHAKSCERSWSKLTSAMRQTDPFNERYEARLQLVCDVHTVLKHNTKGGVYHSQPDLAGADVYRMIQIGRAGQGRAGQGMTFNTEEKSPMD